MAVPHRYTSQQRALDSCLQPPIHAIPHRHNSAAWSTEALERGVQHARNGDLDAAMSLYQQALQLDPSNADALVGQGAALANLRRYQDAVDMLLRALGMWVWVGVG